MFFSVGVYLGAGIRAWTPMRKSSMMKEQTRLDLKVSSLICENWNARNKRDLEAEMKVFMCYMKYDYYRCILLFFFFFLTVFHFFHSPVFPF